MSPEIINRPRVFLEVQIGTEPAGRIVIELFSDKTPKTCESFRALCAASYTPPSASKPLTYKLSPFHRIIDEFMIQGGDITAGDGTGGQSIYGGEFADENIGWRNIDKEGLLCMANRGKGTNSSQFFITLAPCEHLNAKHTVFGHVVSGKNVLDRVAKVHVDKSDKPYEAVLVSHCGEIERPKPIKPTPTPRIEPKDPAHPPVPHPPPHQKTPTTPADRTNPPAPLPHNASAKPAAAATSSSMKPAAGAPSPVHNPRPRPPRSRNGLPHPVITAASAAPLAPVRTPDPARPICDAGTRGRGRDLGRGWSR
ncbi:MAG: Pro isomerase domain-containing [Lasallia pustulata]|uniref:peptidylprolyl isomerase n=1 Tax=Lasallia pustulata TaxID=136370 RepID=A0A5M8PZD4_9LECA|nr:MAG: Pro isomerase domain-containing [Lasallia pustulata]